MSTLLTTTKRGFLASLTQQVSSMPCFRLTVEVVPTGASILHNPVVVSNVRFTSSDAQRAQAQQRAQAAPTTHISLMSENVHCAQVLILGALHARQPLSVFYVISNCISSL